MIVMMMMMVVLMWAGGVASAIIAATARGIRIWPSEFEVEGVAFVNEVLGMCIGDAS